MDRRSTLATAVGGLAALALGLAIQSRAIAPDPPSSARGACDSSILARDPSGLPLTSVLAWDAGPARPALLARADADGLLSLGLCPTADGVVLVEAPGFAALLLPVPMGRLDVTLAPTWSFAVRSGGLAAAAAPAVVRGPVRRPCQPVAPGRWTCGALDGREQTVRAACPPFAAPASARVLKGASPVELTCPLPAPVDEGTAALLVDVLGPEGPVGGAQVAARRADRPGAASVQLSDQAGQASFHSLPAGTWAISAATADRQSETEAAALSEGQTAHLVARLGPAPRCPSVGLDASPGAPARLSRVATGSPAWQAGARPGWLVRAIDGRPPRHFSPARRQHRLTATDGPVELRLEHPLGERRTLRWSCPPG